MLFFLLSVHLAYAQQKTHKKVMLMLGSANLPTLQHRVSVAFQLFKSQPFDAIIVSGGCGAHGSSICEASEMKRLLETDGVPSGIIFKEERSKTTIQNYFYSRVLEDDCGRRIIQPADTVYVVSDHWHAISVAARLNKYDHVTAFFHIEGNLQPKATDNVDYVSILHGYADNEKFGRVALWPTPDAVFRKGSTLNIIIGDLVFSKTGDGQESVQPMKELLPSWIPKKVDAATVQGKESQLWLIVADSVFRFSLSSKRQPALFPLPLRQWIKNLPTHWRKIDALSMGKDSLYVFHDDEMLTAYGKGEHYTASSPVKISQRIANFPFSWAGGYVDAADFDPMTHLFTLFKAQEQLTLDEKFSMVGEKPQPFALTWPTAYYGKKEADSTSENLNYSH
ncbi:MAG: YdcF family protein [Chitinophagaceae bacterium]